MDRPDLLYSVKGLMRQMASPRTQDLTALKRVARYTIKLPANDLQISMDQLDSNIEVFGDAQFAGCHSTRKSTVGGVAMWSGQFVKAWSKTVGVLALSGGESELAAVRAATEGMGLQSILNDFCLCGHVAIKSDATAAIGMVHRLGLGTVRHLAVGELWVQHHARSGKIDFPRCHDWRIRVMHKSSILGRKHCCATRRRAIGTLSLMMTSRDECRWVVLCRGVDFLGHQGLVQDIVKHGQKWSRRL